MDLVALMQPPKDKLFLADIGYPYYVLTHWNGAMEYYVYTELQVELYHGEWNDTYFQTDSFREEEIKSWIDFPKKT